MKKAIITIACVAAILTGCTSTKDAANVSWESFCVARGCALNEKSNEVINEYLIHGVALSMREEHLKSLEFNLSKS